MQPQSTYNFVFFSFCFGILLTLSIDRCGRNWSGRGIRKVEWEPSHGAVVLTRGIWTKRSKKMRSHIPPLTYLRVSILENNSCLYYSGFQRQNCLLNPTGQGRRNEARFAGFLGSEVPLVTKVCFDPIYVSLKLTECSCFVDVPVQAQQKEQIPCNHNQMKHPA